MSLWRLPACLPVLCPSSRERTQVTKQVGIKPRFQDDVRSGGTSCPSGEGRRAAVSMASPSLHPLSFHSLVAGLPGAGWGGVGERGGHWVSPAAIQGGILSPRPCALFPSWPCRLGSWSTARTSQAPPSPRALHSAISRV